MEQIAIYTFTYSNASKMQNPYEDTNASFTMEK